MIQKWSREHLTNVMMQIFLSVGFVLIDIVWRLLCQLLTAMECHRYWSTYRKSDYMKAFLCRISMLMIFLTVQDWTYVEMSAESELWNSSNCTRLHFASEDAVTCQSCRIYDRSRQLVVLVLVDITLNSVWEVLSAVLYRHFCVWCCGAKQSPRSDQDFRQPFDLSQEYTEMMFRQFLIYTVLALVPVVAFLGVLGALLEYKLDQVKLRRWTRKPERIQSTFSQLLLVFGLINVAAIFFSYPNGIFWLIRNRSLCLAPW